MYTQYCYYDYYIRFEVCGNCIFIVNKLHYFISPHLISKSIDQSESKNNSEYNPAMVESRKHEAV